MKIFLVKSFFKKNDLEYNFNKIISLYKKAEQDNCDLLIFSEMCITGFPIYDELLNLDFLKKTEEFLEKIVDFTKDKKTRILLGCPYFIPEHKKNEIIKKSELFNSVVLIGDGYINAISSKTNILKSNLFEEYKYFDKEVILKNITYENDNFDILIADDIMENKNIFFIKERDTDFVICLDCEIKNNMKVKKQQLLKIAKWSKKNIIYLNVLGYDYKNSYSFLGEVFVVNNIGENIYSNEYVNEDFVKFETKIINGKLVFENIYENKKNVNFFDIIANNYKDNNIICEITEDKNLPKSKNLKLITFNEKINNKSIEFINFKDYINRIDFDNDVKNIIIKNLSLKNNVDFFLIQ